MSEPEFGQDLQTSKTDTPQHLTDFGEYETQLFGFTTKSFCDGSKYGFNYTPLESYCLNTSNLEQSFFIVILLKNNCEWSVLFCWQVHTTSQLITMQWEHETTMIILFLSKQISIGI